MYVCVCMCGMCVHVCDAHVCMCVHVCVCVYTCVCGYVYLCEYICMCVHAHVYMHASVWLCVCGVCSSCKKFVRISTSAMQTCAWM